MNPTFDKTSNNFALKCPACSGISLHQTNVEIFEREDDANNGMHVVFEKKGFPHFGNDQSCVHIDNDMSGNPSLRRHGVIIHFECEECGSKSRLKIYQHKGLTYLDTEFDKVYK